MRLSKPIIPSIGTIDLCFLDHNEMDMYFEEGQVIFGRVKVGNLIVC